MPLSKEQIEQIRNDAEDFYNNAEEGHDQDYYSGLIVGYKAGATAQAEKAQVLVEALNEIKRIANWLNDEREIARIALSQYKSE